MSTPKTQGERLAAPGTSSAPSEPVTLHTPDTNGGDSISPPAITAAASPRHLQYIDSLRGIAIAGVIAVHVSKVLLTPGLLGITMRFGLYGVQLFYLVSALTLMMSMGNRSRRELHPTLNFFIRRFFRVAPMFYVTFLTYCLLDRKTAPVSFPHAFVVMSFLNGWRPDWINNSPVVGQWSIAVEMTFYAMLPLLFRHVLTFRRAVGAWWISILVYPFCYPLAVHLASWEGFSGDPQIVRDFAYSWFPNQLSIFLCGIGLYAILNEKRKLWHSALFYLPGLLWVVLAHRFYPDTMLTPVAGVAGMIFIVWVARTSPAWIVNRFSAFLGRVSFSAYLCHPLVLIPIAGLFRPYEASLNPTFHFILVFVVTLIFVCGVSQLTWKLIEVPGQSLGKRLIQRLAAQPRHA